MKQVIHKLGYYVEYHYTGTYTKTKLFTALCRADYDGMVGSTKWTLNRVNCPSCIHLKRKKS
jgi:hypothetical protein